MNGLQVDCRKRQEVIQQLRVPNFTQFWPTTPPYWWDFTYYPSFVLVTKHKFFTDHLPTSSCPRLWMTPKPKYYQKLELKSPRTLKVKQGAREARQRELNRWSQFSDRPKVKIFFQKWNFKKKEKINKKWRAYRIYIIQKTSRWLSSFIISLWCLKA